MRQQPPSPNYPTIADETWYRVKHIVSLANITLGPPSHSERHGSILDVALLKYYMCTHKALLTTTGMRYSLYTLSARNSAQKPKGLYTRVCAVGKGGRKAVKVKYNELRNHQSPLECCHSQCHSHILPHTLHQFWYCEKMQIQVQVPTILMHSSPNQCYSEPLGLACKISVPQISFVRQDYNVLANLIFLFQNISLGSRTV